MGEGEQARGKVSGDPRGYRGAGRGLGPLSVGGARGENPSAGHCPSSIPRAGRGTVERSGADARTDRQTNTRTQHHPCPAAALPSTTAKMLLLLLGIIVLHVTVLVLLFVSTIVSVSADFPAPAFRGARMWPGRSRRGYFCLGLVLQPGC